MTETTVFDPKLADIKTVTLDQARLELAREVQLRASVYGKWTQAGKLNPAKAMAQFSAMLKAQVIMDWFAKVGDDIKLGLQLVKLCRANPQAINNLINDPALKALIQAFPDAELTALRDITASHNKEAA